MDSGEIELLIQDNSDNNEEIIQYLKENTSENIKYVYNQKHMTVSENFSEGILNSSGKYICMLGDDDTVSSKIIEITKYMDNNNIESAVFNRAYYKWPDVKTKVHNIPNLTIPKCSGKIEIIDPQQELLNCLQKGTISLFKLPEIYQGIVKRSTVDKLYDKCNTYFPGASPDMALAIALSLVVKSHIYVDAPYTLSGYAFNSAGGQGARHQHKGKLKDMKFLPNDIEEKWEVNIPMVWTGSTIYAESAHKALKAMGREDFIKKFNYSYHYAYFLIFEPEYFSYLKPFLKGKLITKLQIFYYMIGIFLMRSNVFIKNFLSTKFNLTNNKLFDNIHTSDEASKIVDQFIETQNII
jgi:glycosyltransferase involved in cell wall biosynthesis